MGFDGASRTHPASNTGFNVTNTETNQTGRPQKRSSGTTTSRTTSYIKEDLLSKEEVVRMEEELLEDIERLNQTVRTFDRKLEFQLHRDTDRYYVQVIDVIDDEIIREIPPEQVLDLLAKIDEMIGLIIDEKI